MELGYRGLGIKLGEQNNLAEPEIRGSINICVCPLAACSVPASFSFQQGQLLCPKVGGVGEKPSVVAKILVVEPIAQVLLGREDAARTLQNNIARLAENPTVI